MGQICLIKHNYLLLGKEVTIFSNRTPRIFFYIDKRKPRSIILLDLFFTPVFHYKS
jgi:hypothetical protein